MSDGARSLDSIPYDIFYNIASGLECQDFINLSRVNRGINTLMRSELIAKKSIEVHIH